MKLKKFHTYKTYFNYRVYYVFYHCFINIMKNKLNNIKIVGKI